MDAMPFHNILRQYSAILHQVYLSAVLSLHIDQGFLDPLINCLRLQRVLRGVKRTEGDASSQRLPITDDAMVVIFNIQYFQYSGSLLVLGSLLPSVFWLSSLCRVHRPQFG